MYQRRRCPDPCDKYLLLDYVHFYATPRARETRGDRSGPSRIGERESRTEVPQLLPMGAVRTVLPGTTKILYEDRTRKYIPLIFRVFCSTSRTGFGRIGKKERWGWYPMVFVVPWLEPRNTERRGKRGWCSIWSRRCICIIRMRLGISFVKHLIL